MVEAMRMVLVTNTFEFSGRLHTQASGTSIGSCSTEIYAGICVEKVEEKGLKDRRDREGKENTIRTWNRFMDDNFSLFTGTREQFGEFVGELNTVDKEIQFTWEGDWETKMVTFLNITIGINKVGYLETDIFTKENLKNQLLLPESNHFKRMCKNIVYSLALIVVRICSDKRRRYERLGELRERLLERRYSRRMVDTGIKKALEINREEALKRVEKKGKAGRRHKFHL